MHRRVATARGLLLDSALPLAEIATACGFADQSHFTRVFIQFEGAPPGAWRRQHATMAAMAAAPFSLPEAVPAPSATA